MRVPARIWLFLLPILAAPASLSHAQSTRPGMGATPYHDASGNGVTFRVWAPNATSVTVPGQFNGWNTTAAPLAKELVGGSWNGYWSGDLTTAVAGQEYKYFITYNGGTYWRKDPCGRRVVNSAGNSIIYDPSAFNWSGDSFVPTTQNDLIIYELHAGTFYDPNPVDSVPGTLTDAINRLDYLKNLGVSAVELLPICEFPGDRSWGYNPSDIYSVESAYGGPDALKNFVKACHARGLAVFLDVVHNHYGPNDLDLWNFDGWTGNNSLGGGGVYFFESNTNLQITPWGYTRPNFASVPVRNFIQTNFAMWVEECHVDGFRWDTPGTMLIANDGSTIGAAATLLTNINAFLHTNYSRKFSIAEDRMAYGFDSAWDTTFPSALTPILTNTVDANRDLNSLMNILANNARYGGAASLKRVSFLESHDVVGDLNNGARVVTAIDSANPASYRARKLSMLGAALTFTAPGVPMLFQGQEMLENQQFSDSRPVDWTKTNTFNAVVKFYRDLIGLRRNFSGGVPGLQGDQITFPYVDNSNKVLAYHRWQASDPAHDAMVIANLSGVARTVAQLPFPKPGNWHVYFNSDSSWYGADFSGVGTNVVTATGVAPAYASVSIGPYSLLVLSQTPLQPTLAITNNGNTFTLSWPANYSGWNLQTSPDATAPFWNTIPRSQYETNPLSISVPVTNSAFNSFYRLQNAVTP